MKLKVVFNMNFSTKLLRISSFLVTAGAFGCSSPAATTPSEEGGTAGEEGGTAAQVYTPYITDFCGYESWTKYVEPDAGGDGVIVPSASTDGGFIHAPGGRVEYINHTPPHGSTEFPNGTIIVKTIPGQDQIFAMAKRGGGYNDNGPGGATLNWEWFELPPGACPTAFVWQGAFPPANQSYGGTPNACNDCHGGFPTNDYVASPRIQLKDY